MFASPAGMNEADTIHSSGTSVRTRADREHARAAAIAGQRALHAAPPALEPQLDQRADQHDHEQDERDRRREPHAPPAEALLVHEQHDAGRALERPALRHHVGLGEELEVAEHRDHADEQERRRRGRARVTWQELLPRARAVEAAAS